MSGRNKRMARREFLTSLAAGAAAAGALPDPAPAQDLLQVLKPRDIERLRADFNTKREQVRLMAIMSPT